jgi:hypothetical protein
MEERMVERKFECGWTGCGNFHTRMNKETILEDGTIRVTFNPFLPDGWDTVPSHWRKRLIADGAMKEGGHYVCPEHVDAPDKYFSER